jgi:hypothetical protein
VTANLYRLRFRRFLPDHLLGRALALCNRTNRSHEGCGEERESGDVIGLRLRLDYQLDAGACLELLGEVALFAEGNDVVVKGLEVAVGDDGDSERGVIASGLGDAAGG